MGVMDGTSGCASSEDFGNEFLGPDLDCDLGEVEV